MQPHEWAQVKQVFYAAAEVAPCDRASFLDVACGSSAVIREEVESLLAALDEPIGAVDRLLGQDGPTPSDSADHVKGQPFGAYRLERELGRGGMGTVFLARRADGDIEQEVAIKLMRHTIRDSYAERRFRRERQILASLNHPHIARFLDGGVSPAGEAFLVMEYVDGEPLLDYAAREHLDIVQRLKLFLDICEAVAYAHGRLVVHRDIKPTNVLIARDGGAKLLDFGLAKVIDTTLSDTVDATMTALRAFTPSYASPEQVHGKDLSTSSDIYSLGVVLYELLTGVRPFEFATSSIADIQRTLDTIEPVHPSVALRRRAAGRDQRDAGREGVAPLEPAHQPSALEGDLDNIILTALRREPDRRYPSVSALADDVRRHIEGLPVSARPHTLTYRASKFVRRNRVPVAAAVVVLCALVGGLAAALWQADIARQQRDRATRRFDDVRRLSNSLLFELSPRIERLQGATEARDLLVRRAVVYLDSLASESADDLQLQLELASAYEKIGDLQGNPANPNLIELDAAIGSYRKARDIRARVLKRVPDSEDNRSALAENYRVLGSIHSQANDFNRAAADLAEALRLYEQLVAASPRDVALRKRLAQTTHDIGRSYSNSSRYAGALVPFERTIAAVEALRVAQPTDLDVVMLLADTYAQHGLALSWEGRQDEAEAQMARAAELYEPLVAAHPNDVRFRNGLWSVYWLTSSVFEEQDDALSHVFAQKALDTVEPTVRQDGSNIRARQQLAKSYSRLGQTATNTGRAGEAVAHLEAACAILGEIAEGEARNGRLRSELALALTRLAEARFARGNTAVALADAERAATIYGQILATFPDDKRSVRNLVVTHQLTGDIQTSLGHQHVAERRDHFARAGDSYRRALGLLQQLRAQNALAESDGKFIDQLEAKVAQTSE